MALFKLGGVSTNTTQQVQQTQKSASSSTTTKTTTTSSTNTITGRQLSPIIQPHEDWIVLRQMAKSNCRIITTSSKWDGAGDWNLVVEDNEVQLFKTTMGWTNATSGHSHEF